MSRDAAEAGFQLYPQLAADTAPVTDLALCRVLLMNDRRFPWLILVPRRAGKRDLDDLAAADQAQATIEASQAARALKALVSTHKMNVAALGNMVPQLHIHVIARQTTDAAWPKPVWGVGSAEPYAAAERDDWIQRVRRELQRSATS